MHHPDFVQNANERIEAATKQVEKVYGDSFRHFKLLEACNDTGTVENAKIQVNNKSMQLTDWALAAAKVYVEKVEERANSLCALGRGYDEHLPAMKILHTTLVNDLGGDIEFCRPYFNVTVPSVDGIGFETRRMAGTDFTVARLRRYINNLRNETSKSNSEGS